MDGSHPARVPVRTAASAVLLLGALAACSEESDPSAPVTAEPVLSHALVVPAPLEHVAFGARALELWPFTGTDHLGTASDPINLLFPGGDPLTIRAALMLLDGDRSAFGFPNAPPFDCTWVDAIGANQTAYTSEAGWTGSAIADVAAPVPVLTDGRATILNQAVQPAGEPMTLGRDFTLHFDQVIPKPFCASGPFDFLLVRGPIEFRQRVVVTPSGHYVSQFHAIGRLDLKPVNPLTNPPTPVGEPYQARVIEHYRNILTDRTTLVSNFQMRVLLAENGPLRGHLLAHMSIGPGESSGYSLAIECS